VQVLIQAAKENSGVGHLLDAHPGGDSVNNLTDQVTVGGFKSLQENYTRMRDQYVAIFLRRTMDSTT
jgi:hypothetical protein